MESVVSSSHPPRPSAAQCRAVRGWGWANPGQQKGTQRAMGYCTPSQRPHCTCASGSGEREWRGAGGQQRGTGAGVGGRGLSLGVVLRNCRRCGGRDTHAPAAGPPPGLGGGSFAYSRPPRRQRRAPRGSVSSPATPHACAPEPSAARASAPPGWCAQWKEKSFLCGCAFMAGLGGPTVTVFRSMLHPRTPRARLQPGCRMWVV